MTVRYHRRGGRLTPDYVCEKNRVEKSQPLCQRIPGGGIDEAVGQLLVQRLQLRHVSCTPNSNGASTDSGIVVVTMPGLWLAPNCG